MTLAYRPLVCSRAALGDDFKSAQIQIYRDGPLDGLADVQDLVALPVEDAADQLRAGLSHHLSRLELHLCERDVVGTLRLGTGVPDSDREAADLDVYGIVHGFKPPCVPPGP